MSQTPVTPLNKSQFGLIKHTRQQHEAVIAKAHANKETLENPDFWAHVKPLIRGGDTIDIRTECNTFAAHALVVSADTGRAYVRILWGVTLDEVDVKVGVQTRFVVKHRGNHKWCVVDTNDDRNVRSGLATESAAMLQLEDHLRMLAN